MTRLRAKRVRKHDESARRALWILIGLTAVICLPSVVLILRTRGPDLFDLTPIVARWDQYMILAWPDLERAKRSLKSGAISSGVMIRALGYMMEGNRALREGDRVRGFVLLPDAGDPMHPSHRFGDQMIDVHLEAGSEVRFSERSLVWAWGTLRMLAGDPSGHEPLYVLEHARAQPASKADIEKYFK